MKFFSAATLLTLGAVASLVSAADSQAATDTTDKNPVKVEDAVKEEAFTTFNGQKVPRIKDVGDKALDDLIKDGYTAVKFFSPMCHHCTAVAPVWQTLYEYYWTSKPVPSATNSQESLNDFHHYYGFDFANVNCIAFGDTCTKYEVNSYPTFIIFHDGKVVDRLGGGKDMSGLGSFIEKTLETIRPGSRVKGGPEWPEVGVSNTKDFDPKSVEAAAAPPAAGKIESASVKKSSGNKKPTKSATKPNPLGTSVPLEAESFQKLVTMSQEPWFIKFYAPWCHHCQAMAPNWVQLSKEMEGKLNIGEVDCEAEPRLCKDAKIRGFPTLVFFQGGERVDYDGLRGLGDLVSYANSAIDIGQGVRDVDATEFKKMEETNDVIFVYFYDLATTTEDFIALERLTLSLIGHAKIVKTKDPAMSERFKITTWPRLIVSRDGRPTYFAPITPNEMRDYRQVLHWMKSVWLPIVPELLPSNSREIMNGKIVVLGILTRDRPDEFMLAKNEIKSAAMEWMDKQTQMFQLERQDFRDAKQLRIEEAEARNDQRALRAAKTIRIDMNRSERKEVGFAWVDGVFWERWIRTTFGIEVTDGERVIINDEDNRRYWDTTITGNYIIPSRTSILETIPKVVTSPPKIKPKLTISSFSKVFFDIRGAASEHSMLTIGVIIGVVVTIVVLSRKKKRSRGGFFRLDDEKNLGLLGGGGGNGKVD